MSFPLPTACRLTPAETSGGRFNPERAVITAPPTGGGAETSG